MITVHRTAPRTLAQVDQALERSWHDVVGVRGRALEYGLSPFEATRRMSQVRREETERDALLALRAGMEADRAAQ